MTVPDEKEKSYQAYFEDLYDSLTLLRNQLGTSLEKPDELYKQLVTVEDTLETLLNWIKLEKNAIRNFETIVDWSKKLTLNSTLSIDDIRSRLRVILLPQVQSFTQNISTGERSALKVLEAVTKNLEELPVFLKSVQDQNLKLLTSIGYDPEAETSHLDLALFNLYQGRFKDFAKELKALNDKIGTSQFEEG